MEVQTLIEDYVHILSLHFSAILCKISAAANPFIYGLLWVASVLLPRAASIFITASGYQSFAIQQQNSWEKLARDAGGPKRASGCNSYPCCTQTTLYNTIPRVPGTTTAPLLEAPDSEEEEDGFYSTPTCMSEYQNSAGGENIRDGNTGSVSVSEITTSQNIVTITVNIDTATVSFVK